MLRQLAKKSKGPKLWFLFQAYHLRGFINEPFPHTAWGERAVTRERILISYLLHNSKFIDVCILFCLFFFFLLFLPSLSRKSFFHFPQWGKQHICQKKKKGEQENIPQKKEETIERKTIKHARNVFDIAHLLVGSKHWRQRKLKKNRIRRRGQYHLSLFLFQCL